MPDDDERMVYCWWGSVDDTHVRECDIGQIPPLTAATKCFFEPSSVMVPFEDMEE